MTEHDDLREALAHKLAPHLPGGRIFSAMPRDRIELRKRNGEGSITDINDATQDDAYEAADACLDVLSRWEAQEPEQAT